jgi:hypothetical protein
VRFEFALVVWVNASLPALLLRHARLARRLFLNSLNSFALVVAIDW